MRVVSLLNSGADVNTVNRVCYNIIVNVEVCYVVRHTMSVSTKHMYSYMYMCCVVGIFNAGLSH